MSVQLYLGDCLEVMKSMPDKSVDAVITDPPYNVGLDYSSIDDNRPDYMEWCRKLNGALQKRRNSRNWSWSNADHL